MTYSSDEDSDLLPDAILKARVEKMLPNLASAIREAAQRGMMLATSYDSICNTTGNRNEFDSTITGMVVEYAGLHRVHLWLQPAKQEGVVVHAPQQVLKVNSRGSSKEAVPPTLGNL